MKIYCLGAVAPRNVVVTNATNAAPIVLTLAAAIGTGVNALNPAIDVLTISGALVNSAANGSYPPGTYVLTTPTSITLLNAAGNGTYTASSGIASAPQQLIYAPKFPSIPGVTDVTKLTVARMLFTAAPHISSVGTVYVGTAGLNQTTLANVFRPINPPPASGIYDYYDFDESSNVLPLSDYWVDAAAPGTDSVLSTFWIK